MKSALRTNTVVVLFVAAALLSGCGHGQLDGRDLGLAED
jgi:hypothetical protein